MNIRINDISVDFILEHETTFADLRRSLAQWADTEKLELISVLGDGKDLSPDDPTPLESLGMVEVEAVPVAQGAMARLAVIAQFFTLVAHAGEHALDDLRSQYSGIRSVLPTLLSPVAHRLADAFAAIDSWSPETAAAAARIAAEAAALHYELSDPRGALDEALIQLSEALPGEELAGMFQKGEDREGFSRILQLFTAFEDTSRRADLALDTAHTESPAWTQFLNELRPFLGEARDALEAADHILLTDLLEYEIVPRLTGIRACFSVLDPSGSQP